MATKASAHKLLPPEKRAEPLRVNIFEFIRNANAELVPLFPIYGPGTIVPAGTCQRGERSYGRFFHHNSVEEVAMSFGGHGGMPAGMLLVGGRMHEVKPAEYLPPDGSHVVVITQRQDESGDQKESLIFRCEKCNHRLFDFGYDAGPSQTAEAYGGHDDDTFPMFATQWGSWAAAQAFNADVKTRTCSECGHVNPEFPTEEWGWGEWVKRHQTVNTARHALDEAARP